MTETQQRFLRAIAERVPMEQVVELHLFPPIRQGGVETGVAVVAEDPRRLVPNVAPDPVVPETEPASDLTAAIAEPATEGDTVVEPEESEPDAVDELVAEASDSELEDDSPYADDDVDAADRPSTEQNGAAAPAVLARLTIHTARYRLTLKGVDRGKWEVDVVAEADAPLEAVDAVVRGVQRRAGEGAEPDRLNAEAFRGALEAPLATLER